MDVNNKLPELRKALKESIKFLEGEPLLSDLNKARTRLNFVLTNLKVDPRSFEEEVQRIDFDNTFKQPPKILDPYKSKNIL